MKKEFICPYCKRAVGWREVTPVRGHYAACFDENGVFFEAAYSDGMNYYYKSTTYGRFITGCNGSISRDTLKTNRREAP